MRSEPIAIVGRGCVLPGCMTPLALWQAVADNVDLTTPAPAERWGLSATQALAVPYRGGYVHGFESVFDPQRFGLDGPGGVDVASLDPVVQWSLHAVFDAWQEAGRPRAAPSRTGVILANLSYPTRGKADLACDAWLNVPAGRSTSNGFSSGLPAQLVARALGATGAAFALDAACASSLYALQLACRKLQDGTLDVAVACAVNAADELIIQRGFEALQASSPTRRSRPFAADADGLLPAHGSAALVLKRLSDVLPGDAVHGVIRAVGLSNDGRRGGFLAPDPQGQIEAMRRAYRAADIDPATVDFLECHATGTAVGDTVEIRAANELFGDRSVLPAGSLKGNVGHLITVAGMASVLKLVSAFEHDTLPPTRLEGETNPAFEGGCLRPQRRPEPWPDGSVPRAAISNFGFGGNNAHLILDAHRPAPGPHVRPHARPAVAREGSSPRRAVPRPVESERIVVCGIGALAGPDRGIDRIVRRLMSPPADRLPRCTELIVDALAARTPPDDLRAAEPQQLALLDVADEAMRHAGLRDVHGRGSERLETIGAERLGVFVGMGCANDACRWLLIERLACRLDLEPDSETSIELKRRVDEPFTVASVLGAMPNLTANRLSAAFDARGQGFSVAAEGRSGTVALQEARDALRAGELDVALVAAADFASEPIRSALLSRTGTPGDTTDLAAALVLVRASVAEAAGARVLATLAPETTADDGEPAPMPDGQAGSSRPRSSAGDLSALIGGVYGVAPIVGPLFAMAAATGLAARGQFVSDGIARPALSRGAGYRLGFPADDAMALDLPAAAGCSDPIRPPPLLFHACASSAEALHDRLERGERGGEGDWRVALLADDQAGLDRRRERALAALSAPACREESTGAAMGPESASRSMADLDALRDDDIHLGHGAPAGELAFVFTGVAGAYPRMGRGLLLAFPELGARLAARFAEAERTAHLLASSELDARGQLGAVTLLSQAHALLLRDIAGLSPDAVLGLSLGESNALVAFDIWHDGAPIDDDEAERMYERHLGGRFETAARAWGETGPVEWENWRIAAPVEQVRRAAGRVPRVDVTIIYSDHECVIGGSVAGCAAVIASLRASLRASPSASPGAVEAVRMAHPMIVHTPALQPYAETWHRLHTRPTTAPANLRVYSCADNASYVPDARAVADRLTRQALQTIDWRKCVERAWADGVRHFVEIGPCDTLTRSIHRILGERDHLAVAIDRIECADITQITRLFATLFASGHVPELDTLTTRLAGLTEHPWCKRGTTSSSLNVPVTHPAPITPPAPIPLPASITEAVSLSNIMPPAPPLPPPLAEHRTRAAREQRPPRTIPARTGSQALPERPPTGPSFDREAIEDSTTGAISVLFGEPFARQDEFLRQVRLPAPPLLLVHRITGIDAEIGTPGTGVIWTETDVEPDGWYLHAGTLRPGPLVEAGQADLSLISWMGADFLNRGERVYRLLGCEMTIHEAGLPVVGDRLRYQIEITGHANVGDVRLFFFQYDCRVGDRLLLSVRNGRAGFFTDGELAAGAGVLADPAREGPPTATPPAFDSAAATSKRALSVGDLDALRQGDAFRCFGSGFEECAAHSQPPRLPGGRLTLLDEVTVFEPAGGPWQRGYLRATAHVPLDAWFYEGHFHQDPCMPGTLMAEAAVQALELFAMAMGLTIERDGWLFEPVAGVSTVFDCRGQVVPDRPHELSYEVFVDRIVDGDTPEVHASLMASCDGHKVFHCPHYAIRLRRNWPGVAPVEPPRFIGPHGETRGDATALLACGNGAPSAAFGEMYRGFDSNGRAPRLPQPPFHLISRVLSVSTRPGRAEPGASASFEYDIPPDAWYFDDNRCATLPLAVFMEICLQPCGWLASHGGFALQGGECFRNLDGDALFRGAAGPADGSIRVNVTMTRFSTVGSMTIVHFELDAALDDGRVLTRMTTSFGFFPRSMLVNQAGLPTGKGQREHLALPPVPVAVDDPQDLLPGGRLSMFDHVDRFDAEGGGAGLGFLRAQQIVDPYAWYFKAHFFQDPVQPGSLGVDALRQALMCAVLLKGLTRGMRNPSLDWGSSERRTTWSYRGQVTPRAHRVTLTVELLGIETVDGAMEIEGSGSLWRDGQRIYALECLTLRLHDEGT